MLEDRDIHGPDVVLPGMACALPAFPVGRWRTFDDKTGEVRSIVNVTETNGVLTGRIESVFLRPIDPPISISVTNHRRCC